MGSLRKVRMLPLRLVGGRGEDKGVRSLRNPSVTVKAALPLLRKRTHRTGDPPRLKAMCPGLGISQPCMLPLRVSTIMTGSTTFLALSLSLPTSPVRIK